MDNFVVCPVRKIKQEITVPGDKSISHRAAMLGSLARGETIIANFLMSQDCLATIDCFRKMGIEIQMPNEGRVIIRGKGLRGLEEPKEELYVGNSGTTIRLMAGILSGQTFISTISGDASIQKRPMGRVVFPLRGMGAIIEGNDERFTSHDSQIAFPAEVYAPLKIIGNKLKGITYEMPVASAQVKSAILLAGIYAEGETAVIEKNPSRDHTERMLRCFGAKVETRGQRLGIRGQVDLIGKEIDVPGDISSAAFFLVAGAIVPQAEIVVKNAGLNPTRAGIIDVLRRMGAAIKVEDEAVVSEEPRGKIITRSSGLKAIKIDGEIIPRVIDEIPIIAVAATQAEGATEIRGAKELRVKESDRIKTIASELRKMGAKIEELEDGMKIFGPVKLKGAKVQSYGDHRIAMALSIAGLAAEGQTTIEDTECIATSFPGFTNLLEKL